jgi:enterochelin esterase-like enzyme
MKHSLYQWLLRLHPPQFRERFAEEMVWIFEEEVGQSALELFTDGIISLLRQWILRSGAWKLMAGAVASSLLIFGWWHSQASSLDQAFRRGNPGQLREAKLRFRTGNGSPSHGLSGTIVQAAEARKTGDWPIRSVEISPRIVDLKQRLDSGAARALEEFWSGAAQAGTPLIETPNGSSREVIVTFVWRGDSSTNSVELLAPLANSPGLPTLPLKQLRDTNLWYGCWQMRDDLRFTYRFVTNRKPGENPQQSATPDPLNAHQMEISFEGGRIPPAKLSIASMPRAPEERWIAKQADVPTGKLEEHSFKSTVLESDRKVWVYTPFPYDAKLSESYRLLVLFDGFSYQNWIPAPTILDNLIHAGKVPAMVVVLIDNPPESRMSELQYNPKFAEFVSSELLPWIHDHWNVTRDPQKTIVGGYSAGGAAAAFLALQLPDSFGNVLSQSGAFWSGNGNVKWEWLATRYEMTPKLALRFFIEAGLLEDTAKDGPTLLAANQELVKVLKSKGYATTYLEVGGTHEPVHWRNTFADGLISLTK